MNKKVTVLQLPMTTANVPLSVRIAAFVWPTRGTVWLPLGLFAAKVKAAPRKDDVFSLLKKILVSLCVWKIVRKARNAKMQRVVS